MGVADVVWVDEHDDIWNKLKIWVQDEQGNSKLYSLAFQAFIKIQILNGHINLIKEFLYQQH